MELKRGNNRKIRTRCTSEQLGREVWPFCVNNMYDSQAGGIHQVVNASKGSTVALRIKLSEMTQVKLSKRERKTNLLLLSSEVKCKEESKETKMTDRDPRRHLSHNKPTASASSPLHLCHYLLFTASCLISNLNTFY